MVVVWLYRITGAEFQFPRPGPACCGAPPKAETNIQSRIIGDRTSKYVSAKMIANRWIAKIVIDGWRLRLRLAPSYHGRLYLYLRLNILTTNLIGGADTPLSISYGTPIDAS